MPKTFATLINEIEQQLQDTGNATFDTTELTDRLNDAIREVSQYKPRFVKESFSIESRTGTATATTASALVDTDESQFVSGDVNKVVYNKTDNTWAIVTAYVSTSQLTLSKDIMASGEDYALFNKECFSNREINIADIGDYLWIEKAEYPAPAVPPAYRNFEVNGDILRLLIDFEPDDSKVDSPAPDTEVFLYFAKQQWVTQLTDTAAAVNNEGGYAAAATTMILDALQSTGTIAVGQEFTVAGIRGTYRVTAEATIAANAATITFYPGLQSAVENDDVVTFVQSTLTPELERLVVDLATARALLSKGISYLNTSNVGGANVPTHVRAYGNERLALVLRQLRGIAKPRTKHSYSRGR